jgi:hypothetical protein
VDIDQYREASFVSASDRLSFVHPIWEDDVSVFMVERDLKGISMEALGGAQKAAIEKAQEMTGAGVPVRYIRSAFTPADGRCLCFFEAGSAYDVKRLNDEAALPYHHIIEAMDLTP